jgi:hypothetical protein
MTLQSPRATLVQQLSSCNWLVKGLASTGTPRFMHNAFGLCTIQKHQLCMPTANEELCNQGALLTGWTRTPSHSPPASLLLVHLHLHTL